MLLLVFTAGGDRFALDATRVVEVLPLVEARRAVGSPRGVVGTCDYRGSFVPLVDLSAVLAGQPAAARLSTRILLVERSRGETSRANGLVSADEKAAAKAPVGLIAEGATETVRCATGELVVPPLYDRRVAYLGPLLRTPQGIIQLIDVDRLIEAVLTGGVAPAATAA